MSVRDTATASQDVEVKALLETPGVEAYFIPVSAFPPPENELLRLRIFVRSLTAAIAAEWKLSSEVFLQFNQFHLADAGSRLRDHAREWRPALGLAADPQGPAPTIWSKEEFEQLDPGQKLRPLCHKVFRITAASEVRRGARDLMLDVGAVLEFMVPEGSDKFLDNSQRLILPQIKERVFQGFPFHVPRLGKKNLTAETAGQISAWLCGAEVYLAETVEDGGLVLISLRPLRPFLARLGVQVQSGQVQSAPVQAAPAQSMGTPVTTR